MADNWTDADVAKLRELVAKEMSTREIADRLKNKTRNAIIGKMHRLKLRSLVKNKPKPAKATAPLGQVLYQPFPHRDCCHWPLEGGHWCGDDVQVGKPYCLTHLKASRANPQPRPLDVKILAAIDRLR